MWDNFHPFSEGEQQKVTWNQAGTVGGWARTWMFCSLIKEGHSDLGFVGFCSALGSISFFQVQLMTSHFSLSNIKQPHG